MCNYKSMYKEKKGKPRELKILLIILRDYIQFNPENRTGLCNASWELHQSNDYSEQEFHIMRGYLNVNIPWYIKLRVFINTVLWPNQYWDVNQYFWWNPSRIKPRVRWLNRKIKELS